MLVVVVVFVSAAGGGRLAPWSWTWSSISGVVSIGGDCGGRGYGRWARDISVLLQGGREEGRKEGDSHVCNGLLGGEEVAVAMWWTVVVVVGHGRQQRWQRRWR